jgi:hypothetical protein
MDGSLLTVDAAFTLGLVAGAIAAVYFYISFFAAVQTKTVNPFVLAMCAAVYVAIIPVVKQLGLAGNYEVLGLLLLALLINLIVFRGALRKSFH